MYVVRLSPKYLFDPFYDKVTGIHLTRSNPQASVDVISPSIARALAGGKLLDVLGNIGEQNGGETFLGNESGRLQSPVQESTVETHKEVEEKDESLESHKDEVSDEVKLDEESKPKQRRGGRNNGKAKPKGHADK